jgi:hypothetical protein
MDASLRFEDRLNLRRGREVLIILLPGHRPDVGVRISWRPRGNGIGPSNGRFQPRSDTGGPLGRLPVWRHAFAAIKAAMLLGSPILMIAE